MDGSAQIPCNGILFSFPSSTRAVQVIEVCLISFTFFDGHTLISYVME